MLSGFNGDFVDKAILLKRLDQLRPDTAQLEDTAENVRLVNLRHLLQGAKAGGKGARSAGSRHAVDLIVMIKFGALLKCLPRTRVGVSCSARLCLIKLTNLRTALRDEGTV